MKVLLVDGSAMAYRAFYAFARTPLVSSRGEPTSVPFAFLTTVLRWMRRYSPDAAAVVFDAPGRTHRHALDASYKAHRPPRPEGLTEQMPRLHQALAAMRLPVVEIPGWEADDVLATLATQLETRGDKVFLASGDKDFRQLVSSHVRLVRPTLGSTDDEEIGPDELRRSLGLGPEHIVDLMALVGDPVDNVAGIAGVGEKTAVALLREHQSLDALLERLDQVHKPALRRKLTEGRAQVLKARELVRLRTDAPVEACSLLLPWPGPDWPVLRSLLRELELVQLLRSLPPEVQAPRAAARIVTTAAELQVLAAELASEPAFAVHVEPDTHGATAALGLAWGEERAAGIRLAPAAPPPRPGELDLRPPPSSGLDVATVRRTVASMLSRATTYGCDLKAQAVALHGLEIHLASNSFDVTIASYVLHPERHRHDLEALVLEHLDEPPDAGRPAAPEVKAAAAAARIWRLQAILAARLAATPPLEELFVHLEMPLVAVLDAMERVGIRVDVDALASLSAELEERVAVLTEEIHGIAGHSFNLQSTQQLGNVLFEELALPHGRRTRQGWSTDSDVLETLAPEHEIARALLEYRQLTKLRSTYCEALPKLVDRNTGRIHTTFHQTVASTGRLSSSDPNLQNIPARSELGRRIRAAFVPANAAARLVSADYSQIELRILAHLSSDEGLAAAFTAGGDVHTMTAARLAGCQPDAVTATQRAAAKMVNFGVVYGMGARGLADRLGIELEAARQFIDEYFATYPLVRRFTQELVQRARQCGYATTILGRRLALPDLRSTHPGRRAAAERVAINAPIQGSAADLIKRAMVSVHAGLISERLESRLVLQVHDELVFDVPVPEVEPVRELVRHEMESAMQLRVPLVVDVRDGRNWAEAH